MEIRMETLTFKNKTFPVLVFNNNGQKFALRPYVHEVLNSEEDCVVQTLYGVVYDDGDVTSPFNCSLKQVVTSQLVELEYFPLNCAVWYQTVRLMIIAAAPAETIYSKWGMLTADPTADDGREIALGIVEKFVKEVTKFFRNEVC